jgi:hypothetical protein
MAAVGALLALLLAGSSRAEYVVFHVDPARSWVRVGDSNGVGVYLGPGLPISPIPFASQIGRLPSVSAFAQTGLPGTPDGLGTRIEGRLLAVFTPDASAPTGLLLNPYATMLRLTTSGTWRPGTPDQPTKSAPAALAFSADAGGFTSLLFVALRRTAFQIRAFFPVPASRVLASTGVTLHIQGGEVSVGTTGSGITSTGALLEEGFYVGSVSGGSLEDLGEGEKQITLPLQFDVALDPQDFGGIPASANFSLTGQIVATTTPVPEPSLALAGLAAWMALAAFARLRRESTR